MLTLREYFDSRGLVVVFRMVDGGEVAEAVIKTIDGAHTAHYAFDIGMNSDAGSLGEAFLRALGGDLYLGKFGFTAYCNRTGDDELDDISYSQWANLRRLRLWFERHAPGTAGPLSARSLYFLGTPMSLERLGKSKSHLDDIDRIITQE